MAYYCPEALSDQVEAILLNTDTPCISQLTELELTSAISRKIRERAVSLNSAHLLAADIKPARSAEKLNVATTLIS